MRFPYLMTNCCQYFAHRLKYKGTRSPHFTTASQTFSAEDLSFLKESFCSLLSSPLQVTGTVVQLHICTMHFLSLTLMLELRFLSIVEVGKKE